MIFICCQSRVAIKKYKVKFFDIFNFFLVLYFILSTFHPLAQFSYLFEKNYVNKLPKIVKRIYTAVYNNNFAFEIDNYVNQI